MKYRIKTEFLPGVLVGQECEVVNGWIHIVVSDGAEWKFGIPDFYAKQHPEIFEPVRWKPERSGQYYYWVSEYLSVRGERYMSECERRKCIDVGNCFETQEAAEQARDKIKKLLTEYA